MENYKYRLIDKEIILSEEEHKQVTRDYASGKSIIYLRGGRLMINMAFVGTIIPTEQLTEAEERKNQELLALAPDKRSHSNLLGLGSGRKQIQGGGMKHITGNGMKECLECKQTHFIPEDRTLCLPCLHRKSKEK